MKNPQNQEQGDQRDRCHRDTDLRTPPLGWRSPLAVAGDGLLHDLDPFGGQLLL
jgi:hypothetical protein